MTLQDRLRSLVGKDLVGSQPLPDGVSAALYEAADWIDELEDALEHIVGFEGPNTGKDADEMRRRAITVLKGMA